jgi:hypothetical protein
MVEATENRPRFNGTDGLNLSMYRSILVQCSMGSRTTVVGGILAKDPPQMARAEHDQVVDASPSDRADQPLCVAVLPGCYGRNWLVANAHGA